MPDVDTESVDSCRYDADDPRHTVTNAKLGNPQFVFSGLGSQEIYWTGFGQRLSSQLGDHHEDGFHEGSSNGWRKVYRRKMTGPAQNGYRLLSSSIRESRNDLLQESKMQF